jgi:hypothetical protein
MRKTSRELSPSEFCNKYLPPNWAERDLQLYVQRVIKARQGLGLYQPPDEVKVKTPNSKRRADLATPITIYEVKCFLTYDNIYHAVGQSELYARYGSKILWFIKKRRIIIGVAPTEEYQSASRLAKDFSSLRDIKVVFINECPEWHLDNFQSVNWVKILLAIIGLLILFIVAFVAIVLVRK